ncbi:MULTISPECIES: class I SAM-dependent methyltransferase [unclassified Pedobacter]|uniref:class I SAM-dependent methyltransferase n=1 Tax=unclassified Pedobacter TaxID=2628915 RepID=UPI001421D30E|nr:MULTISPECIES: SAM-dependent methyltransferase [unclassified Pedobacter]NII85578.1 SAM-dependent methyltransferase [Pedobacter sp. SG908]NMN39505.1 SAM-dependent methyltransferase [Pedobacter sp. SG918]
MPVLEYIKQFTAVLKESVDAATFVKVSLGNYKGEEEALKQILIRKVVIKREDKLAFTYRYKTRDVVKNYTVDEAINLISDYLNKGFKIGTLFTTEKDLILEELNNGKVVMRENKASSKEAPSGSHDKEKTRLIKPDAKSYLTELKITDTDGKVFKNAQDKFRQINHYIEILSALIKELPAGTVKKVADMGSGKGYLTFALYDYLHSVLKLETEVVGVEYRQDMVDLCNQVAVKSDFSQLNFVQGTIEDYKADNVNLLIALHACDTATDDAIFKGIKANAELIVVAPCCHKQIRREIEQHKVKNDVSFLTKYGIFLERQAEMVTDGIRALILEYFGYKTKVFEFISDAHTPKNVLVVGIKGKVLSAERKTEVLKKIKASKEYFGIGYHHLEKLLGL